MTPLAPTPSPSAPPRNTIAWLAVILVVATALRVHGIGDRSLRLDEVFTWKAATAATAVETATAEVNQPPLWYLLTRAWIGAFGDSDASLRMPAAIFGVLCVALLFFLARRLFGRTDGALWAAVVAAVSPSWVGHSQDARMYAALVAEVLACALLLLRYLDDGRRRDLLLYFAVAATALYTHYVAAFALAAQGIYVAAVAWRGAPPRRRRALGVIGALVAAGAAFAPWLFYVLGRGTTYWEAERAAPLVRLAEAVWRIGVGDGVVTHRTISNVGEEAPRIVVLGLLWLPSLVAGAWALGRPTPGRAFLLAFAVLPVALTLAAKPSGLPITERYVLPVTGFLFLVMVVGIHSVRGAVRAALVTGLAVAFAAGLAAWKFPDAPWVRSALAGPYADGEVKAAHAFVAERAAPGDVVVIPWETIEGTWGFYDLGDRSDRGRPETLVLRGSWADVENALDVGPVPGLGDRVRGAGRVFLVTSRETPRLREKALARIAEARGGAAPTAVSEPADFPDGSLHAVRVDVVGR